MSPHSPKTNALILETSPYLLQHAYNPVEWFPYSESVFEKARSENKPLLISIGYSACHWCHVMEQECFEDPEVAAIMNRNFINVKVDREEHSDVDMLYMQAVQLMTGQGGWPLNCFVLPDGRAFYGGTYFPKAQWLRILDTLSKLYQNDHPKLLDYAEKLSAGLVKAEELVTSKEKRGAFTTELLRKAVEKWKNDRDKEYGGPNRAPKFPMPVNYLFLLRYAKLSGDAGILDFVYLTLNKMAAGGIYDQLRGGFSRYSTDMQWKVPHFEKMLYDNAQLISLYTEAYLESKNPLYREVALQSLDFVAKEWTGKWGNFYSAFDADSEGVEGRYYVWTEEELQKLLGKEFPLFKELYEVNKTGYWEDDQYILMRSDRQAEILVQFGLDAKELEEKRQFCLEKLRHSASSRTKPGLDDKSICSWNAMMCSAFARAYLVFEDPAFKSLASENLQFLLEKMRSKDGRLYRTFKNGQAKIPGFLEDYAFTIEALLNVYLIHGDEALLKEARVMMEFCLKAFENSNSPFLYYSEVGALHLPIRNSEVSDNVIPASNSQMAINMFCLSRYFSIPEWEERAKSMLECLSPEFLHYPPAYSNWGILGLHLLYPFFEVAVVGKDVEEKTRALYKAGLTNTILAPGREASDLPLFKNRYKEGKTLIYVCRNNTCQLPVEEVPLALEQLERT